MNRFFRKTVWVIATLFVTSFVTFLSTATGQDAATEQPLLRGASAEMLVNACTGCHGENGISSGPSIPTIAGMSSVYLVRTLQGFKRDKIPSTVMGRIAKGYTTEEFEKMGDYFYQRIFIPAKQEADVVKAKKGEALHRKHCERCHSESGTVSEDEAGLLKGQWKSYLSNQLMDFQNKDRKAPRKMTKRLKRIYKKYGAEGFVALVEYYASQ